MPETRQIKRLQLTLAWSDTDEVWIASCAEFPALKAHGAHWLDAMSELRFVLDDVIADLTRGGALAMLPQGKLDEVGKVVVSGLYDEDVSLPPAY